MSALVIYATAGRVLRRLPAGILARFVDELDRYAIDHSVPVFRTEVSLCFGLVRNADKLLVTQRVEIPPRAADDYLVGLHAHIARWAGTLPPAWSEQLFEWFALEVTTVKRQHIAGTVEFARGRANPKAPAGTLAVPLHHRPLARGIVAFHPSVTAPARPPDNAPATTRPARDRS